MKRNCYEFFKWHKDNHYSLTFDDVSLRTRYSQVNPRSVKLDSKITTNVTIKTPIVSAAMDTVSDSNMAIALAKEGGMTFIHKNMTPVEQAWHVSRVKKHLNGVSGLIEKPKCVKEDMTIEDIEYKKIEKQYSFSSFLVVDEKRKLKGLITKRHFLFCDDPKTQVSEIMETEVTTAPEGTNAREAIEILKENKIKTLPIVDDSNIVKGLYTYKDLLAIENGETSQFNMDEKGRLRVGAAISDGTSDENIERLNLLLKQEPDVILIDSAHGDTDNMVAIAKYMNKNHPNVDLLVGNISEPESAKRLLEEATIHGLKVGQGPGSICSTRKVAGIGCPQLSAVYEIVEMAAEYDVPVCADGGIKYSGDIVKAIGAGAHTVMLGSLLAGTKEAPGEEAWIDGKLCKSYRGMGSEGAMKENAESRKRYRQDVNSTKAPIPEGVEAVVPYRGTVGQQIHMLTGGVKNGFGYCGSPDVESQRENADFRRVTPAGAAESMPHSVQITKRPPNL